MKVSKISSIEKGATKSVKKSFETNVKNKILHFEIS